jgi:hypothetical protein
VDCRAYMKPGPPAGRASAFWNIESTTRSKKLRAALV